MNFILRWLRHLSASDTAVRAVEESLLDWKHEVDVAPGVFGAFMSDFRMAAGIGRLVVGVVLQDVADAMRRPWLTQMLMWLSPTMIAVAVATVVSFSWSPQIWWWGLPGAALPYAAVMTIARARQQPPALGLLVVIGALCFVQIIVWQVTHTYQATLVYHVNWSSFWVMEIESLLLPTMCILLADRVRREARPNVQLLWCAGVWCVARVVQVQTYSFAGGIYRPWMGWVQVAVPTGLWLFFLWKQERAAVVTETEEAHA